MSERASDGHFVNCAGWEDCECFPDRKDRKIEALRREVRSRGWTIVGMWVLVALMMTLDGLRGHGWGPALGGWLLVAMTTLAYPVGDWFAARARRLVGEKG